MDQESLTEIGERGNVVEAARFPGYGTEQGARDGRSVEVLEKGRQARERDRQLRNGTGTQEGLDRRNEQRQGRFQLAVRGVQQRRIASHEPKNLTSCSSMVPPLVSRARCGPLGEF